MPVSMVQFGQKLPVLPLFGNMEGLEPKADEHQGHVGRARGSKESVFRSDDRVLLGLVAASLV
jgi:hypothetical protein